MECEAARISKEPKVRRQEILDTAMSTFMEKGYKVATMRDITAAMHVVLGLCYRYFESRQVLYDTIVEQYIRGIAYPMVELLREAERSLDGFLDKVEQLFMQTNGREKHHHFFRKREDHDLQMLMSVKLCEIIEPYMEERLRTANEKGATRVGNIPITASCMLFGAVPVLENGELSAVERTSGIRMIIKCVLSL